MIITFFKNSIEILFFSTAVYFFSQWLNQDKRHPLLLYFYLYCALFSVASVAGLSTISLLMISCAPFCIMMFVLFHQHTLQRNFITITNKTQAAAARTDPWIEQIIRASLYAMNIQKTFSCIIEQKSSLEPFFKNQIHIDTPIHQKLLGVLIDSNALSDHQWFWCSGQGILKGIDVTWDINADTIIEKKNTMPEWKYNALVLTLKTDAIILKAHPETRTFTIVAKGNAHEALSAPNALTILEKHIHAYDLKEEIRHEKVSQSSSLRP